MSGDNVITLCRIPSDPIPHDLTTDILARLPAKSLARFLCVSTLWASTIRRRDFINSFMTQSSTRPYLVFTLSTFDLKNFVFSSPRPQNPDQEPSFQSANYDMKLAKYQETTMDDSVGGLICFGPHFGFVVCNPSKRQLMTLPEIKSRMEWRIQIGYFGYDPIEDKYKTLWVTNPEVVVNGGERLDQEIQVFTLGDEEWRSIEGCPLHFPCSHGTCINGVVYYAARRDRHFDAEHMMVCFDVRSEKFNLINAPLHYRSPPLINFEGKLAIPSYLLDESTTCFYLWILEDARKQEWSKKVFVLPHSWRDLFRNTTLAAFRVCSTDADIGDIVLAPIQFLDPLYVLYYNPEKNTLRRVGFEGFRPHLFNQCLDKIWTFPNHIENIMFL